MSTTTPVTTPQKCATCEMLRHTPLACADCHTLADHVQGADYFELFGLPRSHRIDADLLRDRYLAISRNIHPDAFAAAGGEMQALALRLSAAVNRAYDTLSHPILRAEYLLETSGGRSAADDKRVPADLLPRVMMMREQIEEARAAGDGGSLADLRRTVSAERQSALERVDRLAARLGESDSAVRDELRSQLNAMKYYDNLLAQL